MQTKLTIRTIDAYKPNGARLEIADVESGLYLYVETSGARRFVARYRVNGVRRKRTLGPAGDESIYKLETARESMRAIKREIAAGLDPDAVSRATTETADQIAKLLVPAVWAEYKARHLERNVAESTRSKYKSVYTNRIEPAWKAKRIDAITKKEVLEMLDAIPTDECSAFDNAVTTLSAFFGWCLGRDIIKALPIAGIKKNEYHPRHRTLNDAEIKTIWDACDSLEVNRAFAALIRLLILTGARRCEISDLQWSEIDFDARTMTIPGNRTKNGLPLTIYLTNAMLGVLRELPRFKNSPWVITSDGRAAVSGFANFKAKLDKATGQMVHWTLHDTRRTISAGCARLGVAQQTVERILNHKSDSFAGIVGVYQTHNFAAEMRAGWERWSDHVAAVVTGKSSNVVSIRRA
jgi:integrase